MSHFVRAPDPQQSKSNAAIEAYGPVNMTDARWHKEIVAMAEWV
jgi:hypothetical protein